MKLKDKVKRLGLTQLEFAEMFEMSIEAAKNLINEKTNSAKINVRVNDEINRMLGYQEKQRLQEIVENLKCDEELTIKDERLELGFISIISNFNFYDICHRTYPEQAFYATVSAILGNKAIKQRQIINWPKGLIL